MSQLGLDGTETMLPLRLGRPLTERQRELVAYMRAHGVVSPTELGVLMHQGRETPCVVLLDFRRMRVGCCEHASSDGGALAASATFLTVHGLIAVASGPDGRSLSVDGQTVLLDDDDEAAA
jgi:hypothetical protein